MIALLLTLVFGFFNPTGAQAAQDAIVTVENAPVREKPDLSAQIIEEKTAGEKIRVSSFSKNGWYKVRTKLGEYGWIWQASLTILNNKSEKTASEIEIIAPPKEKRDRVFESTWYIRGYGFGFALLSSNVSQSVGLSSSTIYWTPGAMGEAAYQFNDTWRVLSRIGFYNTKKNTSILGVDLEVDQSGIPFLLGIQKDVASGKLWNISASLYGGVSLRNRLKIAAYNNPEPNSFEINKLSYAAMLSFDASYWISRSLSLIFEIGAYFSQSPSQLVTTNFNGAEPFRGTTNADFSIQLRHAGPIFALGVQKAL